MRLPVAIGFGLAFLVSCADDRSVSAEPAGPWSPVPDIPTSTELTCGADGSVTLSSDTAQSQPEGVHIRVVNELGEPVSVEGFDANPGVTDWVLANGPGTMELMCWPYSQHSGDEPPRHPLEIVDPVGLYVDGSVACEFEGSTIVDRAEASVDRGPPSMKVARELITGLQTGDMPRVSGYPERDGGSVVVIRDGVVIASYGIARFDGRSWSISAAKVCPGTGLAFEGEDFG
jgi:hypothetical protein